MQANWRIGSLFGIPLYVDSSWFVILAVVTIINGSELSQGGGNILGWITGFFMALLLFASVLLHELGHSLVAKAQGIPVNSITLFLFGGIASIGRESKTPAEAFQVAIAGPIVSITLAAIFYGVTQFAPDTGLLHTLTSDLWTLNLILGLFNLIPGLPLDGGQVLKAAVWKFTGNRFAGVRWAATTGKLLGYLGIAFGLFVVLMTGSFGGIWVTLIAWFILRNATAYEKITTLQQSLLEIQAAEIMTRDFRVVDANLTLREFADSFILAGNDGSKLYYAASDGRYRGLVSIRDLQSIERSEWEEQTLTQIACPLTNIPYVEEQTSLAKIIGKLEQQQINRITVLSPAGAVAGVIDKGDIVAAIATKHNLPIPDAEIKRIKTEGTYPAGLQLGAIVKAIQE